MKTLECKNCGAPLSKGKGNSYICEYCGSTFLPEASEGSLNSSIHKNSSFTSTSVSSSSISLSSDVERLLEKCKKDPKNARKYANLILDIDPDNIEALKYI